jgi:hypothetical protein
MASTVRLPTQELLEPGDRLIDRPVGSGFDLAIVRAA